MDTKNKYYISMIERKNLKIKNLMQKLEKYENEEKESFKEIK